MFVRKFRSAALILSMALTIPFTPARAGDFQDVWGMSPQSIRSVSNQDLCASFAAARWRNLNIAVVSNEVARRSADCSAILNQVLGACAPLGLVDKESVPGQGTIFTVSNSASYPVSFHINYRGIASSSFTIAPRATQRMGVRSSPGLSMLGGALNRDNPDVDNVIFFDCRGGF